MSWSRPALGELHIRAQLRRHQAGQMADLDAVLKHVLAVARAITHAAEQLDQLVVDAVHIRFKDGLLTGPRIWLSTSLWPDHSLSMRAGWMRLSAISFPARFAQPAANRVKRGDDHRLGRIAIIRSTPVAVSSVRMLRPSRPMMRPLSLSGRATTETVVCHMVAGAALNRHRDDVARLSFGPRPFAVARFRAPSRPRRGRLPSGCAARSCRAPVLRHLRNALHLARLFSSMSLAVSRPPGGGLLADAVFCARRSGDPARSCLRSRPVSRASRLSAFLSRVSRCHAALAALHPARRSRISRSSSFLRRMTSSFASRMLSFFFSSARRCASSSRLRHIPRCARFSFLHVLAIHVACRNARGQRGCNRQRVK